MSLSGSCSLCRMAETWLELGFAGTVEGVEVMVGGRWWVDTYPVSRSQPSRGGTTSVRHAGVVSCDVEERNVGGETKAASDV